MRTLLRTLRRMRGFTLIELLTVMAIIAILAGLILSIASYARKKAAIARTQAEIQALSAGCESYKADNGSYPHQGLWTAGAYQPTIPSDLLDPRTSGNSTVSGTGGAYTQAALELYEALTGDIGCTGTGGGAGVRNYVAEMRPDVWGRTNLYAAISSSNMVTYLSDPFQNCYGYSTANSTAVSTGSSPIAGYSPATGSYPGYNPTFDLWSTGGATTTPNTGAAAGQPGDSELQWIKNW